MSPKLPFWATIVSYTELKTCTRRVDNNGGLAAMSQLRRWRGRVVLAGVAGIALVAITACGTEGWPQAAGTNTAFSPAASASTITRAAQPSSPTSDPVTLATTSFRQ